MNSKFDYRGFEEYLMYTIWKDNAHFFEFENGYFVKVETSFLNKDCWSVSIFPHGTHLIIYPEGGWDLHVDPYDESLNNIKCYHEVTDNKVKDILQIAKDLEPCYSQRIKDLKISSTKPQVDEAL